MNSFSSSVDATARAQTACALYAASTVRTITWWSDWIGRAAGAGLDLATLEGVVSARGQRLAWSVWGGAGAVDGIARLLEAEAASAAELDRLYDVARRGDGRWGAWAAQVDDGVEGGWAVRGRIDLPLVEALVDDADDLPLVLDVAERFDLDEVGELARGVAAGAPSWDLVLPLDGGSRAAVWSGLLEALGLPPPPAAEHAFLDAHRDRRAAITVRLFPRAVSAVAIRVAIGGKRERIAALAAAGIGPHHDGALAAVEGALAVVPSWVAFTRRAGAGPANDLDLGYADHARPTI